MKKSIYLLAVLFMFLITSCTKGYTHEKVVTNNSRSPITVSAGCCDYKQEYKIQPGESEVVFACIYQQISKPTVNDLSWEVQLIQEGQETQLNAPEMWVNKSHGRTLSFEYVAVD